MDVPQATIIVPSCKQDYLVRGTLLEIKQKPHFYDLLEFSHFSQIVQLHEGQCQPQGVLEWYLKIKSQDEKHCGVWTLKRESLTIAMTS